MQLRFIICILSLLSITTLSAQDEAIHDYFKTYCSSLNNYTDTYSTAADRKILKIEFIKDFFPDKHSVVFNDARPNGSKYITINEYLDNLIIDNPNGVQIAYENLQIITEKLKQFKVSLTLIKKKSSTVQRIPLIFSLNVVAFSENNISAIITSIDVTKSAPSEASTGSFIDERDGQTYKWVRLKDGKKWMAENLNYKIDDSWCYENNDSLCTKYGRLYTWEAAKQACPEGWRLPSDNEWWEMTNYYGKAMNDEDGQPINIEGDAGEASYKTLKQYGNTSFSALLGGTHYTGGSLTFSLLLILSQRDFYDLGNSGYYWSSTENSSSTACSYRFFLDDKKLSRNDYNIPSALSCRCIQD